MNEDTARIPVVIVGGGVVGLSASLFLAANGVRSVLVERSPSTCVLPRARGVNGRTMELMRELQLDDAIRKAGARLAPAVGIYTGTSVREILAEKRSGGWLLRRMRARGVGGQPTRRSPTSACRCTQEDLEPILLEAAQARGVDARFSTELASFEQDADGVDAVVVDRRTGARETLRCSYLIAADGARGAIREQLGIASAGRALGGHQLNIYFRADLGELVQGREFSMCLIENGALRGLVASIDNHELWTLHVSYHPDRGESPDDYPPERCVELIRRAIGIDSLDIEIKGISPWRSAVRIADRYREGRVFLAGDSAHAMPPWGGFGANTGIQDAHNLAWKLAAVLRGYGGTDLLATYESERLPVARSVGEIAGSMNDERGLMRTGLPMLWHMRKVFPYLTMGYGYTSSAIVHDRGPAPGPGTTDLRGRPGTRAPHVWIRREGERISSLDLFGTCFVLFAGRQGSWADAARAAEDRFGVHVHALREGVDFESIDDGFASAYGLAPRGAVLVRPDGIVAWRTQGAGSLDEALARVLARHVTSPRRAPPEPSLNL
jgi:putative polyketide hydroxylase